MQIIFSIKDIQKFLENRDDGIFECAHLIAVRSRPINSLKKVYDQAKQVQVEGLLILQALRAKQNPDIVDVAAQTLAEKLMPPLIKQAETACNKIVAEHPSFALR